MDVVVDLIETIEQCYGNRDGYSSIRVYGFRVIFILDFALHDWRNPEQESICYRLMCLCPLYSKPFQFYLPLFCIEMDLTRHDHGAIGRNPDGSYYYTHGAFLGHIVPGSFFIIWGVYWLLATFHAYLQASALRRQFSPRSWYLCPWGTAWLRAFPLEPVIKIVLPSIGILGEVWLGHPSWRTLIGPDGKFVVDNINDWQHSAMYSCFVASGITDLLGHFSHLPAGIDRAFLGLAFLCQGVLLVFHLKGPQIEILVHLILVLQIFATVIATFMEGIWLDSLPTAAARPILTILQVSSFSFSVSVFSPLI